MDFENYTLFSVLFLAIIPLFFWYRVRYVNKRRDSVKSKCSNCGYVERRDSIENYSCSKCGHHIIYLDESGERIQTNTYNCSVCGTANLNGIVNCTICGKEREEETT
ncbi:MAG: hypothetical protein ABJ004_05255 [Cyclobacteriaceae bacterium]